MRSVEEKSGKGKPHNKRSGREGALTAPVGGAGVECGERQGAAIKL
jgi:hypothetical protein